MRGIQGLKWSNVFWVTIFLALVPMIASADGYLKLNYSLVTKSWQTLSTGGKNLWIAQGELAKQIDKGTAERYGYDPTEPRAKQCTSQPMPSRPLTPSDLGLLKGASSKNEVIAQIGLPYCSLTSGADIWLVGRGKVLRVEYSNGVSTQLLKPEDLSKIDAKTKPVPKSKKDDRGKDDGDLSEK